MHDATALATAIDQNRVTALEVMEATLSACDQQADLGAVVHLDAAMGRAGARAAELVPVTVSANARLAMAKGELFGGLGYSMAVFNEITSAGTVSGTKPGFELRTGVRIETDLVQPSMWAGASGGVERVDIEFLLARRQHQAFGIGTGFDFSAWRVGLGLVVRL